MLLRVYQLTSVLNSLIAQYRRHRAVLISPRTFYMSDHLYALQIKRWRILFEPFMYAIPTNVTVPLSSVIQLSLQGNESVVFWKAT